MQQISTHSHAVNRLRTTARLVKPRYRSHIQPQSIETLGRNPALGRCCFQ
jgi:hypothetical protein